MVLSKCKGTAMIIEWLKKKNNTKTLVCEDCKFYDNGFCIKQEMKCYYPNKTQCNIFELDMSKNVILLLDIPEKWFVQKYIGLISEYIDQLKDASIKGELTQKIFQEEKYFNDYDTAEEWVDALVEFVENMPKPAVEKVIKNLQNKPKEKPIIQKITPPTKTIKLCKVCGVRATILEQDICPQCKQKMQYSFNTEMGTQNTEDDGLTGALIELLLKEKQEEKKISKNTSLEAIFMQCKKSAGCWFIVKYLKDIEANYDKFDDMDYKKNFALKIFLEAGRDKRVENTMVRVNCMLRLVENGLVERAYNYAINSRYY